MKASLRIAIATALLAVVSTCLADKWTFVVAGDGRSDSRSSRDSDHNGINVTITKEIADAVLREHAKFLAWTGDLVLGYSQDPNAFESQLLDWRGIMKPLYDARIPVLPCRGNHDSGSKNAAAVWNKVFDGPFKLPQNGPDTEKNLTWFLEEGDVLFLGLHQYTAGQEQVDQKWVDKVLVEHKKPFVFAMGHEPAFMDGHHEDTMDSHPVMRDIFWESLIAAGSRAFFCGHDHLYDHMKVVRSGDKPGPEMHQFVAGTSGAPFYPIGPYSGQNTVWTLTRQKNIVNTFGYLLVTIDGKKCTIEFKGRKSPGVYETMDSWSYAVG